MKSEVYLLALEGGGSRCQAILMDREGQVLSSSQSSDVNTNFVAYNQAQLAVQDAVRSALESAGVAGNRVTHFVAALVGPRFGAETFGELCPATRYLYYREQDVIFARAGLYRPHGVAVVAATGASAFAIRQDDRRRVTLGGWGSLLGDEGSAYAMGLLALRNAARHWEGRLTGQTGLVQALCEHLGLKYDDFKSGLIALAYRKPLSRAEIGGLAPIVTRLAGSGDWLAESIVAKVANDLTELTLHAARRLFQTDEVFSVVVAGGMLNAGEMILVPLRKGLASEFPQASLTIGTENPATALGRLALYDMTFEE